jgi:putative flippase GtrA
MVVARAGAIVTEITGQLSRYVVIGVVSNVVLYTMYLGLTGIGGEPKIVMSALYLIGALQTFLVNRDWTFRYRSSTLRALVRYFIVYGLGYAVNLAMLILLAGMAGWNHRVVQAAAVLCVAALVFAMHRCWVFRSAGQANDAIG